MQTILGAKLNDVGVKPRDVGRGAERKVFVFPPLNEFRAAVSKALGLPIVGNPGEVIDKPTLGGKRGGVVSIEVHKAKKQSKRRSA